MIRGAPSATGPAVVVAVDAPRAEALTRELADAGVAVRLEVAATDPAEAASAPTETRAAASFWNALARSDLLILQARRATLTAPLVAACDRLGVRIVALCADDSERRLAERFGVDVRREDADAAGLLAPSTAPPPDPPRGRVIVVWGAAGAPGRTTLAIELACELARDGRRVALVDADAHAPSVALATGLADEGPGFAAACRQAQRGALTTAELQRIALPLAAPVGVVDVLTGINRPGRWPELGNDRVTAALAHCREWADDTIVDVAHSLEQDEEIVSDLDAPRRNAATVAAVRAADLVVAVMAADPVGVARFVRAHAELRAVAGGTPVKIVVNKLRTTTLGFDARGQVRRTLERYLDAREVWFVPWDSKASDAAALAAQPVARVAPRSPLATAVRRFVGEAIEPPGAGGAPVPRSPRRRARGARGAQ